MLPGFSYEDFNNLASFKKLITKDTAAIMIEPIQSEGGVRAATQAFMDGLCKLCDEHNLLLLFDEVQTGWCRTGEVMAFMHYGVKPDILSMANMGGGMPISAIVTSKKVVTAFNIGAHGTTYGGNPFLFRKAPLAFCSLVFSLAVHQSSRKAMVSILQSLIRVPFGRKRRISHCAVLRTFFKG